MLEGGRVGAMSATTTTGIYRWLWMEDLMLCVHTHTSSTNSSTSWGFTCLTTACSRTTTGIVNRPPRRAKHRVAHFLGPHAGNFQITSFDNIFEVQVR